MKHIGLLLVCLAIMPMSTLAGEIFNWVDKDGKVHYSDVSPADAADVERKKLSSQAPQNEDMPYETRRAQQNFPVTLYVTNSCGALCDMARSMLSKRGIPFSEKLLKYKEDVEAFKKLTGIEGVPSLSVGRNFLNGFLAEQWNSELDIAGYPKTSSYRAPGKPAAPVAPPSEQTEPAAQ
jgi:glutaredoxin